jgi:hybrid cluster-associated redox disulfide protein
MLDPGLSVDEIMRKWPATIAVVVKHGMLCVGCPIGSFHTVAEACAAHGLDRRSVTDALLTAIGHEDRSATARDDSRQ